MTEMISTNFRNIVAEDGVVIEKRKGMMLSRPATMLEIIGSMYIEQMMHQPNVTVEHDTEITLIAHYTKKGDYRKAEEVIQNLLNQVEE